MNSEQTLQVSREFPLGCGCLTKLVFTLGLYFLWWISKQLVVTDRRVVWKSGVFGRSERSIPIGQVTDVSVAQGFFGRLFGYGTVRVESAGGPATEIVATGVSDPGGIRNAIFSKVRR